MFHERKLFAAITAGLYFAAVVLGHHEVSRIVEWMNEKLSFKVSNNLMLYISILITLIFGVLMVIRIRNGEHKQFQIASWLFTAALVVVSYKMLIVVNVEAIHYLQYALLTVPVFALVTRYGETVFWVTFLGALDEAYQYFVLYPHRKEFYFDFNDIVLNQVGAGIGVALVYTLLDAKSNRFKFDLRPRRKWHRSPAFLVTAIISFGVFALYATGLLRFYPGPDAMDALIVLSRVPAQAGFWVEPAVGKTYHILSPLEGVVLAAVIMACYSLLDRFSRVGKRT